MKRISLGAVYEVGLLAVLFLIVLHAPITVWLGTILPEQQTVIKAWKEILLVGLAVLAGILITKQRAWRTVLHSPAILLGIAYVDLHLLMALIVDGEETAIVAGLMIDLRFVAMFILMYLLISLRPWALTRVLKIIAAGAVVVLGFGLLQITVLPDDILRGIGYSKETTIAPYITVDTNPDYVRINSTLRGPNPLGALAVVYLALSVAYLVRRGATASVQRRVLAIGAAVSSVVVLFATYSRSAYLAAFTAIGVTMLLTKRISKRLLIISSIAAVWLVGLVLLTAQSDWFSNVILHENPESTVVSKSNDGHIESLREGWQRMISEPLGHGVGSTGSASLYDGDSRNDIIIENNYLFIAHEVGWLGLIVFTAFFSYVMVQLWQRRQSWYSLGLFSSGIGLALIGILLPVWTDDTVALIWWGLAGATLASTSGIIKVRYAKKRTR